MGKLVSSKKFQKIERIKMLIAFIGMDGSGKSTLAKETVRKLKESEEEAIYLSPTPYVMLQPLLNLLHKIKKGKDSQENPFLTTEKKPFIFRLWPYLSLVDNFTNYWLRIKPLLKKGHVICDRYFHDRATGFEYYGYCNRLTSQIYLSLIPKPDVVFALDTKPQVAQKREIGQRHSLDFFIKLRKRYQEIANKYNYQVIDTTRDVGENLKQIMRIITSNLDYSL